MDEEISIINSNTRNERVRNFFVKNKENALKFNNFTSPTTIKYDQKTNPSFFPKRIARVFPDPQQKGKPVFQRQQGGQNR